MLQIVDCSASVLRCTVALLVLVVVHCTQLDFLFVGTHAAKDLFASSELEVA